MTEVVPINPPHFRTCVPDIDHRPEGGDGGGEIVATGTPEQVAQIPASFTGAHLAYVLGIPTAKAN